jgi:predicted 2-oxoglutarate/Fe(II)-dependent dioxygenase YbiX
VYNSDSWWVPVETGNLVLFPSSTSHMVEDVVADKTRISIAFNTFVRGDLGDGVELTSLSLK